MHINEGHILVVDDNPVNRLLLTRALREQGYTVTTAQDGQQALALLAVEHTPAVDVVLLDILMPKLDGYATLARIKQTIAFQHLPVIVISAVDELELDVLLIDTHPGLNEETLLSLVISHTLIIVMRPDQQDYEGTGITVKVAQSLQVPCLLLLVNKTPAILDPATVGAKVAQTYSCEVAAVLPHADEMMNLASAGIFVLRYPAHSMTDLYKQVAAKLMS
jgi:CheY-like chemotaxis protein